MRLVSFPFHSDTIGAQDGLSPVYRPAPDCNALKAMAQEKVCQDLSLFAGFLAVVTTDPCEVEPCAYFGPIATDALIREILMKPQATDKQLAEGWKELRSRFLAEYPESVERTYQELLEAHE